MCAAQRILFPLFVFARVVMVVMVVAVVVAQAAVPRHLQCRLGHDACP
jgi:hypothetical protein